MGRNKQPTSTHSNVDVSLKKNVEPKKPNTYKNTRSETGKTNLGVGSQDNGCP